MDVVLICLNAVARGEWTTPRTVLPQYLHWTEGGVTIRGRTKVLAHLAVRPVSSPPTSYELRDGQIYRWTV
ncbi:MAG: hypothetical protein QOE61_3455 [Micromonosporaceae bacterium]|nr:hypothetical protein [Micromonosporaceae bacterium]